MMGSCEYHDEVETCALCLMAELEQAQNKRLSLEGQADACEIECGRLRERVLELEGCVNKAIDDSEFYSFVQREARCRGAEEMRERAEDLCKEMCKGGISEAIDTRVIYEQTALLRFVEALRALPLRPEGEDGHLEILRTEIEQQYIAHPTGCGGSFGEILCHEMHTRGLTFLQLARKWGVSLSTLGELIWDHCKKLEPLPDPPETP